MRFGIKINELVFLLSTFASLSYNLYRANYLEIRLYAQNSIQNICCVLLILPLWRKLKPIL